MPETEETKINDAILTSIFTPEFLIHQNEFGLSVQKLFNQPEAQMADLLPVRWSNFTQPIDYCNLQDIAGKLSLVVRVKNQGDADAPTSTTSVNFGGGVVVAVQTPPIPAGQFVDVNVPIPGTPSTAGILFTITVDAQNNVIESNKDNNVADGECVS